MHRLSQILFVVVLMAGMSAGMSATAQYRLRIDDANSLVRVGMDPHPTDSTDIQLSYTLLGAIDNNCPDSIVYVRDRWREKSQLDHTKDKAYSSLDYILTRWLNSGHSDVQDVVADELYDYFSSNGFERLKHYLTLKYELNNYRPRSVKEFVDQRTFYEDMLMFNDPYRKSWDGLDEVIKILPSLKGSRMVDIGTGFGYNAFRFLPEVGDSGIIYATDTQDSYIEYLKEVTHRRGISNIQPIVSTSKDISVNDSVDLILMSSLYHIIYTWSREDERTPFLNSISQRLKDGGHMVIVDNINLHGQELNNCHVSPELVKAQLGYYNLEPVYQHKLNDQRYALVLRKTPGYQPPSLMSDDVTGTIVIDSPKSLVHIGSLDSYDITDRGIDAAQYVYDFMSSDDKSLAAVAIEKYNDLIPAENFGGEYSALQWLCEVRSADDETRESMLRDPLSRSFYHKMTDDSCKVIKYYLLHKYKLGDEQTRMLSDSILEKSGEVGRTHRSYLEDYILALNPKRPSWEHTQSIIDFMDINSGETIADIGSGSGFFTDKFAKIVGDKGKVYAVEIKDEHIQSLKAYLKDEHIDNVDVIVGSEEVLTLPQQVDKMFMCSLYHILYGVISDDTRDKYLTSLVKQLRPGGELYIVDNGPVAEDTLPYHGPYINKELIINQLGHYGFELVDYSQFIPQRYILRFRLKK